MISRPAFAPSFVQFLRTPSVSRTVVGLLTVAMVLLLLVNLATFVMIQRSADYNDRVEHTQEVRLSSQRILTGLVNAETAQRGYLLTGRPEYLAQFEHAVAVLPDQLDTLMDSVRDNPEQLERITRFRATARERFSYIRQSIALTQEGRIGEAVQIVRAGRGTALMASLRQQADEIDRAEAALLAMRTARSEQAAEMTMAINALAGLLIVVLALVSLSLIRRYVNEIVAAREEVAEVNAGLEAKVAERTADLTRANEEIQRFAYIVSHDLRAPLVNVMGYTSELEQAGKALESQINRLEGVDPDLIEHDALTAVREDVPEAIGFIRASTQKMDRLINAILKLSREGRRGLVAEPLDMTAMAQQIADSVNHQVEDAGASIVVSDLPGLENDRLAMEQVLGNLIDNAVKYLDPDRAGLIEVTGEKTQSGARLYRIADNGRGIAPRDHERIFELFRRSGKQDRGGEGLGLAFVRNSVRRMGGTIDVESELGKGSTFILKFPKRLIVDLGDAA